MKCGALALFAASALWAAPLPDASEIVQRSVANTTRDWEAAPQYSFTERDVVAGGGTRTSRVIMLDGSPYYRLVEVNGEPLSREQAAREERKYLRAAAARRAESPDQRRKRIGNYEKQRRQDNSLLREMVHAFQYKLVGEETLDGRRCFVLQSTPRPDYQPPSRETEVLTGMRGKMWVDETQYQWVKVTAEVFRPVTFGLFIARVDPGTQFLFEQRPVQGNGNLWLPSHFSMRVRAKVLHFWSHNASANETYWDYSRAPGGQALAAPAGARGRAGELQSASREDQEE